MEVTGQFSVETASDDDMIGFVFATAASNPTAWLDNTVYDFRLLHQPGHIQIEVRLASTLLISIESSDATYPSGRFGFYNYSQEQSRYQFFAIQPKLKQSPFRVTTLERPRTSASARLVHGLVLLQRVGSDAAHSRSASPR